MASVSFVIVTYNRSSYLRIALQSVMAQTQFADIKEIIVVNNGSTDNTSSVLEELVLYCPKLRIVTSENNLGGAGGFALGIETAVKNNPDWIGLMDDDVQLDPHALEQVVRHMSGDRILACLRLNLNGTIAERASRRYDLSFPFIVNPRRQSLCDLYKQPGELMELERVAFCSFEGMFLSTELILKIGHPRKEYFIFGDDCDYCIRARQAGARIFIVRDAVLRRLVPYDPNTINHSWKTCYIYRNFFVLHFLYGSNVLVRLRPYFIALTMFLNPFKPKGLKPFSILSEARRLVQTIRNNSV